MSSEPHPGLSVSLTEQADDNLCERLANVHTLAFSAIGQEGWSPSAISDIARGSGGKLFIADMESACVGFALYRMVLDEVELMTIAVDPAQQGRKIGQSLMAAAEVNFMSAGVQSLFLEVRSDNEAAILLYEKVGFEQIGKRNNYYRLKNGSRVDALMFSKTVS